MKNKLSLISRLLLLVMFCHGGSFVAQNSDDAGKALPLRSVSEQQWKEASGTLDYRKDVPEYVPPPPEPTSMPDYTSQTQWLGQLLQVLVILALVGLVVFGLYKMLAQPRNRRLAKDGVEITLENLEEYLHETDLDRFLREALARQNYALAIRLYYLQLIKNLSAQNLLRWSREKTNRDYLREMQNHRLYDPFRSATRTFERVWYGNVPLSAQEYATLEPAFKNLLSQI